MTDTEEQAIVPQEIIEELHKIVNKADARSVLLYAEINKAISKGFRLDLKNVPIFRKKIKANILPHQVDPDLIFLAPPESLPQILETFSLITIEDLFSSFIVFFGESKILAAMLLDERVEVRSMVWAYLQDKSKLQIPEEKEAEQRLIGYIFPLEKEIRKWLKKIIDKQEETDTDKDQEEISEESPALAEENKKLKNEIENLKKSKENEQKKSKRKITALKENIKDLQKIEAELKTKIEKEIVKKQSAIHNEKKAQEEKNALQDDIERKIKNSVEAKLNTRLNFWLKECETLDREVKKMESSHNNIISEAEHLLQKQAERDKHLGNIIKIKERIKHLQELSNKVKTARKEAVNPLEDLKGIEDKLVSEIDLLYKKLGQEQAKDNEFVEKICARINVAKREELGPLKQTLNDLCDQGIMRFENLKKAYTCYSKRMSIEYASLKNKAKKRDFLITDPLELLNYCIEAKDTPLILLLDGHNIIGKLPHVFEHGLSSRQSGKYAREKLKNRIDIATRNTQIEVLLFFDSPEYSKDIIRKDFKVVYSGGGEKEQRADKKILNHLRSIQNKSGQTQKILVTDDRDLRAEALKAEAKYVHVDQFADLILD